MITQWCDFVSTLILSVIPRGKITTCELKYFREAIEFFQKRAGSLGIYIAVFGSTIDNSHWGLYINNTVHIHVYSLNFTVITNFYTAWIPIDSTFLLNFQKETLYFTSFSLKFPTRNKSRRQILFSQLIVSAQRRFWKFRERSRNSKRRGRNF